MLSFNFCIHLAPSKDDPLFHRTRIDHRQLVLRSRTFFGSMHLLAIYRHHIFSGTLLVSCNRPTHTVATIDSRRVFLYPVFGTTTEH